MVKFKWVGRAWSAWALASASLAQQGPVTIVGLIELSGTGATAGTNFDNGVKLAVKEINAAGGILGRKIDVHVASTRSRNPGVAKALAQKAVDEGAYVVMGPVFSGSIIVSMAETKRAEIPNFTGGEAANITQQGNPYVFRTSFTQSTAMPKLARYIKDTVKAKIGRDDLGQQRLRQGRPRRRWSRRSKRRASRSPPTSRPTRARSTSPGAVLKAKQSNADALFVYTNEEESARALRELQEAGLRQADHRRDDADRPEGDRARRRRRQRRGRARRPDRRCAAAGDQGLRREVPEGIQVQERPQRHEGLQRACTWSRRSPRRSASSTRKAFAKALHGAKISVKDYPGVLLDVRFDDNGDLDRESFLVKVVERQAGRDRDAAAGFGEVARADRRAGRVRPASRVARSSRSAANPRRLAMGDLLQLIVSGTATGAIYALARARLHAAVAGVGRRSTSRRASS